jgi:hypothetical protein
MNGPVPVEKGMGNRKRRSIMSILTSSRSLRLIPSAVAVMIAIGLTLQVRA